MISSRLPQAHSFQTHDNVSLSYRHWPVEKGASRGAIVLLHLDDPSTDAALAPLADALDLPDFDFLAFNPRHQAPDFAFFARDVQTFVDHVGMRHGLPERSLYLVANGLGAMLTATWAHDCAPTVRGLTLASPAFRAGRDAPFTRELQAAATRTVEDARAIVLPVQVLVSGADPAASRVLQHRFVERLGSTVKSRIESPGLVGDAPTAHLVRNFVLQVYDAPPAESHGPAAEPTKQSDGEVPPTVAEALPPLSARNIRRALKRIGMRLAGKLSPGIRLCLAHGPDAASALDYVYVNQPHGRGALGRSIDRRHLDSTRSVGLRQRRLHIEEFIHEAMERLAEHRRGVRLMDIAAGHGRYLLDAVQKSPVRTGAILLRDESEACVQKGQALIAEREMQDIAKYVQADAFDRLSLASVTPRPTLAVVSGLYELCPDNAMVRRSLAGVGDAVEDGGYLIYTGQPWQPRSPAEPTMPTRVEHLRPQAELDRMVREAGFRKIAQRTSDMGLYTVSLAIRAD